ncbi:MAG: hydrogenase expression/formation protein HypE [bacterium]
MNYKKLSDNDKILLAHGGGGKETSELIGGILFEELYGQNRQNGQGGQKTKDPIKLLEDAAILDSPQKIAFTTDSFTVSPIFFKGGDIGKLAVAGTVNDLSVMGAKPLFLSLGLIIEEGFSVGDLRKIISGVACEAEKSGVRIVTGDTKVVQKGKADGIFINTSGIGGVLYDNLSVYNIVSGDAIIVSGNIGDHGAAIMSQREGIDMDVEIESDCASLWGMIDTVLKQRIIVSAIRDATRGGLAAVLNEWAEAAGVNIYIEEDKIPVNDSVKGFCELLGFEPHQLACEGMAVFAVKPEYARRAVDILKSHPLGINARVIGAVERNYNNSLDLKGKVILKGIYGVNRLLDYPSGELLPRIC